MVRRTPGFAAAAVGLLAAAVLQLSSCAFLGLDMFPTDLKNVEASFDLDDGLSAKGLSVRYVQAIEQVKATTGEEYVVVLVDTDQGSRLVMLDAGLSQIEALRSDAGYGRMILADNGGNVVCGRVKIPAATPTGTSTLITETSITDYSVRGYPGSASNYALKSASYSTINLLTFPGSAGEWGTSGTTTADLFSTPATSYYQLADILYIGESSPFALLFIVKDQGGNRPFAIRYDAPSSFLSGMATYATSTAASTAMLPSVSDDDAWLTADGIIGVESDKGAPRLIRYEYGTGDELDSLSLNSSTDGACYSFEPEGRYWYRYDGIAGRLYKLRTWWK